MQSSIEDGTNHESVIMGNVRSLPKKMGVKVCGNKEVGLKIDKPV